MATVAEQLQGFVAKVSEEIARDRRQQYPNMAIPTIEVMEGPKYYRIVKTEPGSRSVYCFVSKETGSIYKGAGWKAPAKQVRGSIFDANFGWGTAVDTYGARYLR